jgi:hypothetical protein
MQADLFSKGRITDDFYLVAVAGVVAALLLAASGH